MRIEFKKYLELEEKNPELEEKNQVLEEENPNLVKENLELEEKNLQLEKENLDLEKKNLDLEKKNLEKNKLIDLKSTQIKHSSSSSSPFKPVLNLKYPTNQENSKRTTLNDTKLGRQ